ncbi:unnamed protein product [Oppiella nova]|uniref:BRF2-like C-terminal domain-containing protein n=1 Tax=Oppiella nova TaxID=334625 RepID=A0A7R9L8J2_9ACAR|nr:unnamed protein product [Oppiella nova]CAG2159285.1 unnamed protein product [Oppiella nova]
MANCIDNNDNTNGIDIEEVDTTGDSRCGGDGRSSLAMRCTDEMSGNSDVLRRLDGCLKTGHDIQKYDGITVCVKCGQVFRDSGDMLRADPTQTYACNHDPDGKKAYIRGIHGSKDTFATAKRFNTAVLDTLVSSLSLGKHIQDLAVEKYKTLIATHFRCATLTTKRVLSAICLYITLISEGNIVTIGHICNAVNCTPYEFNRVYNQVIKEFPDFRPEQMPIESLVPVVLSEANIDKTERKALEEKVAKILELERECWLIEGRTPTHIIYAATFLAWKSIKPYERRKVKLTEFCRQMGIEYKHTTCERVTELFNAIKRLAAQLVTYRTVAITKSNISIHLDRVLQYQSSLVFDYNQQMKRNLIANGMSSSDDNDPNHKSGDWVHMFKKRSKCKAKTNESESAVDLTKSDEEMSDSEINKYLRSDREIKMIKKLKKYATDPSDV